MERIYNLYETVIRQEYNLAGKKWNTRVLHPENIYGIAKQIIEVGASSSVSRSYNTLHHISNAKYAPESVSAHTNLMSTIVDRAIAFNYFHEANWPEFSYREIMEAVRRHDLPENIIGDIPDDGKRNDKQLFLEEEAYWRNFSSYYPDGLDNVEINVLILLIEMTNHTGEIGRLLYSADKVSAIIAVLAYDSIGFPPVRRVNDRKMSNLEKKCILHCGLKNEIVAKASEIWTCAYLCIRKQVKYDESGFMTALLVMITLIVNDEWYDWRFRDYQ